MVAAGFVRTIPAGKVVIVIDISESRQNHQSTGDYVHYHRVGGHSEPALRGYLDARSARLTQPRLVGRVAAVAPVNSYTHEDHVFVELKIDVRTRFRFRVAPHVDRGTPKRAATNPKSVVQVLDLAAKLNKEVGHPPDGRGAETHFHIPHESRPIPPDSSRGSACTS